MKRPIVQIAVGIVILVICAVIAVMALRYLVEAVATGAVYMPGKYAPSGYHRLGDEPKRFYFGLLHWTSLLLGSGVGLTWCFVTLRSALRKREAGR
ncbi:hypothetical protein [Rhizobium alvei]|uniref:Transmembrane protein n=1 Tax=Rhizobium alvei TaxID=1132659 RepID=A0ABT8YMU2_9HYPH|nr:hypothetical protein [Rhizobium alvei]MDO6964614.1 hypothetical protein [Rhizobium alvei]